VVVVVRCDLLLACAAFFAGRPSVSGTTFENFAFVGRFLSNFFLYVPLLQFFVSICGLLCAAITLFSQIIEPNFIAAI